MVIPVEQLNYNPEIKDIVIKSVSSERRFLTGEYIIVKGTCRVDPSDWGEKSFMMNFTYEGKPNEPNSKLMEYLRVASYWENNKVNYEPVDTLLDYINKNKI